MPWRIWLCYSQQPEATAESKMRRPVHEGDDVPHWAELAKEVKEFLWRDVEAGGGLAHDRHDSMDSN
jgi:hypothetical protein